MKISDVHLDVFDRGHGLGILNGTGSSDARGAIPVPKEVVLLEVLAFSAQIPWERVKNELSARCGRLMLPLGVVIPQLIEDIRSGAWAV